MELLCRDATDFLFPHLPECMVTPNIIPDLTGFVYVIKPDDFDVVKIGSAMCVGTRLATLQIGSWVNLSAYAAAGVYHKRPIIVEREAHLIAERKFKRLRGEWFQAKPQEAVEVILEAADKVGAVVKSTAGGFRDSIVEHKQTIAALEQDRLAKLRRKLGMD